MAGPGVAGRTALAASIALLVAGLVAVPSFVSSARTAAIAIQFDQECVADLGITLLAESTADSAGIVATAASTRHVAEPMVHRRAGITIELSESGDDAGLIRPGVLLWRPDALEIVTAVDGRDLDLSRELSAGELVVPVWSTADGLYEVESTALLRTRSAPESGLGAVVVGDYTEIPTRPEPAEWCAFRDELRTSAFGDRPPPVMLTGSASFESLSSSDWFELWTISPDPFGLRVDQAGTLVDKLQVWLDDEWEKYGLDPSRQPAIRLDTSIRRSEQIGNFVGLTIEPLRYATIIASMVLLVAASMLVARRQRGELRLQALRGIGPLELATDQMRWLAPVAVVGAGAGWVTGWTVVRSFGPSTGIEPAALVSGSVAGIVSVVAAMGMVAGVIGVAGAGLVDRRGARHRRIPVRVLGEVTAVALAGWSLWRLDRFGGVRQIGVEVRGGDLVAQAFPLLGALAGVVIVARPLTWFLSLRRERTVRGALPILIGVRRVLFAPRLTTAVVCATALAVAVAFQAQTLTRSVERLLDDKAAVIVGSDLSVRVLEPATMAGLGSATTEVVRATADDRLVRVLGVDPASFADAVIWRGDGLAIALADAMDRIAEAPESSALLIDPDAVLEGDTRRSAETLSLSVRNITHDFEIVADGTFFPGYEQGRPMLVVDRTVLDNRGDREVWIRGPVADAQIRLQNSGSRVAGSLSRDEVFDSTSFLSLKWSYDTFIAFSVVLAIVTIAAQILVVESRQRARRAARVLTKPMGLRRRGELLAAALEIGVPLSVGAGIGTVVGWFTARVGIGRLDSLRNQQPPARLVVDGTAVLVSVIVIAVVTATIASVARRRTERGDPMEVMRVAEQ